MREIRIHGRGGQGAVVAPGIPAATGVARLESVHRAIAGTESLEAGPLVSAAREGDPRVTRAGGPEARRV